MLKRFNLIRIEDESGVSGTGVVVEGVEFSNGKVVISWLDKELTSIAIHNSVDSLMAIHGHNGRTILEWIDE